MTFENCWNFALFIGKLPSTFYIPISTQHILQQPPDTLLVILHPKNSKCEGFPFLFPKFLFKFFIFTLPLFVSEMVAICI